MYFAGRSSSASDLSPLVVDLGPGARPPESGSGLLRERALLAPVRPILVAPCDLCQVNAPGSYPEGGEWTRVHLALASDGVRMAVGSGRILARETVEMTLDLEPWNLAGSELAAIREGG